MRVIVIRVMAPAAGLAVAAALLPGLAVAKGMVATVYHPPASCTDGNCKADDPRNDLPCQGLLCSFSSAKSMQPPVTAAQAEAAAQAKAAAAAPTAATAPAGPKPNRRHVQSTQRKTIDKLAAAPDQAERAAK